MGFGDVLKKLIVGTPNVPSVTCGDGTTGSENVPTGGSPGIEIIYPFLAINSAGFNRYNPVGIPFNIPYYGETASCTLPDNIALDCPFDDNGNVPAGLSFVGVLLHGNASELAIIGRKI